MQQVEHILDTSNTDEIALCILCDEKGILTREEMDLAPNSTTKTSSLYEDCLKTI